MTLYSLKLNWKTPKVLKLWSHTIFDHWAGPSSIPVNKRKCFNLIIVYHSMHSNHATPQCRNEVLRQWCICEGEVHTQGFGWLMTQNPISKILSSFWFCKLLSLQYSSFQPQKVPKSRLALIFFCYIDRPCVFPGSLGQPLGSRRQYIVLQKYATYHLKKKYIYIYVTVPNWHPKARSRFSSFCFVKWCEHLGPNIQQHAHAAHVPPASLCISNPKQDRCSNISFCFELI